VACREILVATEERRIHVKLKKNERVPHFSGREESHSYKLNKTQVQDPSNRSFSVGDGEAA